MKGVPQGGKSHSVYFDLLMKRRFKQKERNVFEGFVKENEHFILSCTSEVSSPYMDNSTDDDNPNVRRWRSENIRRRRSETVIY